MPDVQPLKISGINWKTSIFLISTLLVTLVGVPAWVWSRGLGRLEVGLFLLMFACTGLSITVGYHRLFAHCAFRASWPVRLWVTLFGAAAFQEPVLQWASEHRYHHKFTDQDGDLHDPHSIRHGFFWAHMGWLLVHQDPPLATDNVADLRRDPIVAFQERFYIPLAILMGFFLPMTLGALYTLRSGEGWLEGLLAGFLFGATARIVAVHHSTFLINSLAHTLGSQPYDGEVSARDNGLLAFFTFGEGYHNYHHAFQTDYRNGVRAWQWDPSKWVIWTLARCGLARDLRRIPSETIRLARVRERQRRLARRGEVRFSETLAGWLEELEAKADEKHLRFRTLLAERRALAGKRLADAQDRMNELEAELKEVRRELRQHLYAWKLACRQAEALA